MKMIIFLNALERAIMSNNNSELVDIFLECMKNAVKIDNPEEHFKNMPQDKINKFKNEALEAFKSIGLEVKE